VSANESPTAERTRTVVARRITTVTAVCGSFVLVVALLPLALPIALIHDLVRGTRLKAVRCLLLLAWFLFCEVWGLAVTALLLLGEATIARGDRERGDRWFYALESLWSGALFHGAERIFHFRVVVDPASDRGMGPLIVFARHTSIGDVLLPLLLLGPRGLRMRYVMKQELRVDPCLDIVGDRVPNTFVRRDSGDSAPEIAAVVRLLSNLSARDCVVIFPEGTRFTPAKRARVLARIAASGNPEAERRALRLKQVLPPRPGGTLGLLEANPGADVLFFATTGFEGIATVWDLWAGRLIGATIRVFTWRVPYAEIPKDQEGRLAWLAENWQRLDDWVGEHRARQES
jgi:1-acyl-sn-glycerol-3-phosphate acyltransferase